MATFYKYAERDVESQVNWAEISKSLTDMLQEKVRIREEKKASIDKATREFADRVANAPIGEDTNANKWTLQYADDVQQAILLQDRLLKSGRLKLKDYNIMRQNINDGTKNMFLLAAEYQDEYARKMERMKSNDPANKSQSLEMWAMASAEGFGKLYKSKAIINPTDYSVNVALDGMNPKSEIVSVQALKNRIKSDYNYFDVDASNESIAKRLADYVVIDIDKGTATKTGFIKAVSDAMQRPGYQTAIEEAIESQIQNPYNISSVLTENIAVEATTGKAFDFTTDANAAKANANLILLKTENGQLVPQFTDAQRDAVKDFMKGQIEQMIKHDQSINPYAEPRKDPPRGFDPNAAAWSKNTKEQNFAVGAWNRLFTSNDPNQKNIIAGQLLGTNMAKQAGLVGLNFDPSKAYTPNNAGAGAIPINFTYGGQNAAYSRTQWVNPANLTLAQWSMLGNEIHGVDDVNRAMSASGGGNPNATMQGTQSNFSGVGSQRAGAQGGGGGGSLLQRVKGLFGIQ